MAKAQIAEPGDWAYRPDVLNAEEEGGLLARLEALRFDPIVIHGQAARRTARHFGLDYDCEARTPRPGEPVPDWLEPVPARAAELGTTLRKQPTRRRPVS
jgi:hypothetical protein